MSELSIIIVGAGVILWLLILGRVQWLFWLLIASMVVGERRLYFDIGEGSYNIIPFTLVMVLLVGLTLRHLRETLDGYEIGVVLALLVSLPVGLFFGVPTDRAVLWLVPLLSIFLTKHLVVHFVRTPADVRVATYLFTGLCMVIAAGALFSVFEINLGGLIQGPMYYGEEAASHSGFWSFNAVISIIIISLLFVANLPLSLWWRLWLGLIPVLAVLYSSKRAAYVALGMVLLFMLIKRREDEPGSERLQRFVLGVAVALLMLLYVPESTLQRFEGVGDQMAGMMVETDMNTYTYVDLDWRDVRVERFLYGWQVFQEKVLFGGGAGFTVFLHNGYVEVLANMGALLGLPFFMLLFLRIGQAWMEKGECRLWAQALLVFLLSPFMFEAVINRPEFMAFGGFFYGMMIVTRPRAQPPPSPPRRRAIHRRPPVHA